MLSVEDRRTAELLKERLLQAGVPLLEMRVYGSRARGDSTPESDFDVYLLLKELDAQIEARISQIAWEVGFDAGHIITTVEYTPEQVERSPLRKSPFLRSVHREGITV